MKSFVLEIITHEFFYNCMSFEKKTKDSFNILGISVRTTGENGQDAKDIGKLWERFFSEEISSKIKNKKDPRIINLYTDYETDHTGPYTAILGYEVESLGDVPLGMVGKFFAKDTYSTIKSQGKIPDIIIEAWQKVYNSKIKRTYMADFDIYEVGNSPESAIVTTFVSIE